jgi:hypothetical protein
MSLRIKKFDWIKRKQQLKKKECEEKSEFGDFTQNNQYDQKYSTPNENHMQLDSGISFQHEINGKAVITTCPAVMVIDNHYSGVIVDEKNCKTELVENQPKPNIIKITPPLKSNQTNIPKTQNNQPISQSHREKDEDEEEDEEPINIVENNFEIPTKSSKTKN